MSKPSDISRRAGAIKGELDARTSRMAKTLYGEFDQDDAKPVTDAAFHEMVRRNWSDPNWRIQTAQRMGPKELYRVALESFGRNLDGSPSVDSHPDAIAAEPGPTEYRHPETKPETQAAPSPELPSVFPFQGPSQLKPSPTPISILPPAPQPGLQQPPPQIGPPPP